MNVISLMTPRHEKPNPNPSSAKNEFDKLSLDIYLTTHLKTQMGVPNMRHHHRFSRSRDADEGFFAGHDRPSLHALWHAFTRHYEFRGERGGEQRGEDFERRHGG